MFVVALGFNCVYIYTDRESETVKRFGISKL